ncbi:MAG TPA: LytTR family DNA-binding domain-containing protein [Saprospiraceae bacterium]|nr:LytTR family DNA-binding domain-containing protein [Saprospiraceae bacterium]
MLVIPLNTSPINVLRVHQLQHTRQAAVLQKVAFSTREGIYIVDISSIVHCVAMDNYSQVFRKDGSPITIAKTLKLLDACLTMHGFIRVHQTHLVAVGEINFVGQDFVRLLNGKEIPISRANRTMVMERVMENVKMPG